MLLDRRCDAGEAVPHLVLGWLALVRHLRPSATVELEQLCAELDRLELAMLDAPTREQLSRTLPQLVDHFSATLAGGDSACPDRRALGRQSYLLHRVLRRIGRGSAIKLPRRLRLVTVALVLVSALAAVLSLTISPRRGWRGSYFANGELRGPARIREDARINFNWRRGAPMAAMPRDHFSVRWDTCLALPSARRLHLLVGSNDGVRVFVDGKRMIHSWKLQYFTWRSHKFRLAAGAHHLRVEYFENTGDARVELQLRDLEQQRPLEQKHSRLPREGGDLRICEGRQVR